MAKAAKGMGVRRAEWDLSPLYRGVNDRALERDMVRIERACKTFKKKWKPMLTQDITKKQLLAALRAYERLVRIVWDPKPLFYLFLEESRDSRPADTTAVSQRVRHRIARARSELAFFDIACARILQSRRFLPSDGGIYRRFLERMQESAPHLLGEEEERILALKQQPAYDLWVSGVSHAAAKITVTHQKKRIPLDEALSVVTELPVTERRLLHRASMEALEPIADFAASELNAVVLNHAIDDELRNYSHPYSETALHYENKEAEVEALVSAVTDDFSTSHNFYTLKKKLLSLTRLEYADRAAPLSRFRKTFDLDSSLSLLHEALAPLGTPFVHILHSIVKNKRLDAYPRVGKQGGAFHASGIDIPSFMLLNHTGTIRDAFTLAHEFGHTVHSELSRTSQRPLYQHYSTAVAEFASTFFEGVFAHALEQTLTPQERISLRHNRIQEAIATIHRQIAFFNFELELHNTIRARGGMDAQEIARLLVKHLASYLGPAVSLSPKDGLFFIKISHFRRFFYVYSYAYGELLSRVLLRRWREDPSTLTAVLDILCAGGSASPQTLFLRAGIDTTKPAIFQEGLELLKEEVATLARDASTPQILDRRFKNS